MSMLLLSSAVVLVGIALFTVRRHGRTHSYPHTHSKPRPERLPFQADLDCGDAHLFVNDLTPPLDPVAETIVLHALSSQNSHQSRLTWSLKTDVVDGVTHITGPRSGPDLYRRCGLVGKFSRRVRKMRKERALRAGIPYYHLRNTIRKRTPCLA